MVVVLTGEQQSQSMNDDKRRFKCLKNVLSDHLHLTTVSPLCSTPTATTEPGLSSATEEETSGYESEGVRSPSPASPPPFDRSPASSPASPPSGRRPRTAFTAEQISTMEKAFKRNAYLGTQDKAELCKKLSLSDKQVGSPSFAFTPFSSKELFFILILFKVYLYPGQGAAKHKKISNSQSTVPVIL